MKPPAVYERVHRLQIPLYYAPSGERLQRFLLGAGTHENGHGALWLIPVDGVSEGAAITINLVNERLNPDELHVRTSSLGQAGALNRLGILEVVLVRDGAHGDQRAGAIGAGYVEDYARLWRWARCSGALNCPRDVARTNEGHAGEKALAVDCPECLARIRSTYEKTHERLLARDTIKRLGEGSSS